MWLLSSCELSVACVQSLMSRTHLCLPLSGGYLGVCNCQSSRNWTPKIWARHHLITVLFQKMTHTWDRRPQKKESPLLSPAKNVFGHQRENHPFKAPLDVRYLVSHHQDRTSGEKPLISCLLFSPTDQQLLRTEPGPDWLRHCHYRGSKWGMSLISISRGKQTLNKTR